MLPPFTQQIPQQRQAVIDALPPLRMTCPLTSAWANVPNIVSTPPRQDDASQGSGSTLASQISKLTEENSALRSKVDTLSSQLTGKNTELSAIKEEIQTMKEHHSREIQQATAAATEQTQSKITALQATVTKMKHEWTFHTNRYETIIAKQRKEIDHLEVDQHETLEHHRTTIQTLVEQHGRAMEEQAAQRKRDQELAEAKTKQMIEDAMRQFQNQNLHTPSPAQLGKRQRRQQMGSHNALPPGRPPDDIHNSDDDSDRCKDEQETSVYAMDQIIGESEPSTPSADTGSMEIVFQDAISPIGWAVPPELTVHFFLFLVCF